MATQPAITEQLIAFFTSPKGRITRQEYLLGLGVLIFLNMMVLSIVFSNVDPNVTLESLMATAMLWSLPFIPSQFIIVIKRLHDLGLSGFFSLVLVVTGGSAILFAIGIGMLVLLAVMPGNTDANKYGPPVRYHS